MGDNYFYISGAALFLESNRSERQSRDEVSPRDMHALSIDRNEVRFVLPKTAPDCFPSDFYICVKISHLAISDELVYAPERDFEIEGM